ncbi:hypothetical protein [Dactylosporangium sp. CA-233914]|uniref:hypothetical protein n=1 Tax=Dactylosporangium sp. CA-233914 TaxID=3239934 RepID=UPI003D9256C0
MADPLSNPDRNFLRRAIEFSRHALEDEGKTPFGALIFVDNEIMALRDAGTRLRAT